jgi:hypothetical protein
MSVDAHLIEHRFLGSVTSLIHLDHKRFPFSISLDWSGGLSGQRMMLGRRRDCVLAVLICVVLTWPLVALSQEIDEGEFSRKMLGYKLQLLKNQFEQTEMRLLTQSVGGTTLEKLERVYSGIKRLEAEFRCGSYYPDLLDEQIVIIREELRLIPADPIETRSTVFGQCLFHQLEQQADRDRRCCEEGMMSRIPHMMAVSLIHLLRRSPIFRKLVWIVV